MTELCFLADRATEYVYRPARSRLVTMADGTSERIVEHGVSFKFEPISGGLPCSQIASKDRSGRAFGILWVDKAAQQGGISKQEVLDFFLKTKARYHGVKFVLADSDGNPIDPKNDLPLTNEERQIKRDSKPTESEWIEGLPNNVYYCRACEKTMSRGISGHVKSKIHLRNVREKKKALPGAAAAAASNEE